MRKEYTVPAGAAPQKLAVFLRRQGVSATVVKRAKWQAGGLLVNGEAAFTNRLLLPGDSVCLTLTEDAPPALSPENLPLMVIEENESWLAAAKPAGQLVHPTGPFRTGTLAAAYLYRAAQNGDAPVFRPVGRLDRDTSGVMLLAKNPLAQAALQKQMRKAYFTIVQGELPDFGVFDGALGFAENSHVKQAVRPDGKPSETSYARLGAGGGHSLAAVYPRTGRTHQIRVHFAHAGHPLAGDDFYGGSLAVMRRQALHCAAIWLPGRKEPLFCPPPADFCAAALALGLCGPAFSWENALDEAAAQRAPASASPGHPGE